MQLLSDSATLEQCDVAAKNIGLELEVTVSGTMSIYHVWKDGKFKCNTAEIASLVTVINGYISENNDAVADRDAKATELAELTRNFTAAAVLNQFGEVCGHCQTDVKSGGTITVSGGVAANGAPYNTHDLKISRSKKNLATYAESFTHHIANGCIYYI
ncbi:hypothetical protein V8687_23505 (plasmid) [Shewanella baltica]|uniref:hypothetical protein n=1 Tax=Shewanella baltica TaxID=62322 RepID=UPI0030D48074